MIKLENILRKRRQKKLEEEKIPELVTELEKKVQEFEDRSKNNLIELEAAVQMMRETVDQRKEGEDKVRNVAFKDVCEDLEQMAEIKKEEEFDRDDMNNIVIYGIQNDDHELPVKLLISVQNLIRSNVNSEICVGKASRIEDGPEAFGSKPVLATFEDPDDVEEILNHSNFFRVGRVCFIFNRLGCTAVLLK